VRQAFCHAAAAGDGASHRRIDRTIGADCMRSVEAAILEFGLGSAILAAALKIRDRSR